MDKIKNFFSSQYETLIGSADYPNTHIYKTIPDDIEVHRVFINRGGSCETNLLFFADTHIVGFNDEDNHENNPLVRESYERRMKSFSAEQTVRNVDKIMGISPLFDKTILVGDTMDYLSNAGLDFINQQIYNKNPNTLILVGNHDDTRIAGHKGKDLTTRESREGILEKHIKTDIFYHSEQIGENTLLIGLNNCHRRYTLEQKQRLESDIEYAREQNLTIIIAQHEMINTGNPEDDKLPALLVKSNWCYNAAYNFYNGNDKIGTYKDDEITSAVYGMITSNADVIGAIVCGHWHNAAYCEINASYTKDGVTVPHVIPQYVVASSAYSNPFVTIVTIK